MVIRNVQATEEHIAIILGVPHSGAICRAPHLEDVLLQLVVPLDLPQERVIAEFQVSQSDGQIHSMHFADESQISDLSFDLLLFAGKIVLLLVQERVYGN